MERSDIADREGWPLGPHRLVLAKWIDIHD